MLNKMSLLSITLEKRTFVQEIDLVQKRTEEGRRLGNGKPHVRPSELQASFSILTFISLTAAATTRVKKMI